MASAVYPRSPTTCRLTKYLGHRRQYINLDHRRPHDEFLASLNMVLTIQPALEEDLQRAEELTQRTNQLNTTGYAYSYRELDTFRQSPSHKLLVAGFDDKYGSYGKVGLALIETNRTHWVIRLLLMSCRVMNRGAGSALINHIRDQARREGVRLFAEMIPNDVNRVMYMTYKFTHFQEKDRQGDRIILENDLRREQPIPGYFRLNTG